MFLSQFFNQILKILEELALKGYKEVKKDFKQDYDKMISPLLDDGVPTYILYRLDTKTPLGYGWMLMSWTPDDSKIRDKMVYASTKHTLKNEFGSAHITEELHATTKEGIRNMVYA